MAKFSETWCSQCGKAFGPGDHGFSHCEDHVVKPPKFVQIGTGIMQGAVHIATACSITMAKRIANALNFYKPNDRGY